MADPARYDVYAVLRTRQTQHNGEYPVAEIEHERSVGGEWIKYADFKDFKAAQRRNASLDTNTALGIEVAQLRAENERLRKAGDAMRNEWIDEIRHGDARRMSLKTIEKLFPRIAAWNAAKEGRDAK